MNDNIQDNHEIAEVSDAKGSKEQKSIVVAQEIHSEFSGPLPHPELLAKYEEVLPGAAERIFQMSEQQSAHRRKMEADSLHFAARDTIFGIVFGFIIAMAGIIGGLSIVFLNPSSVVAAISGTAISGSSLLGIIQTFVIGSKKHKDNHDK